MGLTFILTVFAWIFFRANNLNHALNYIGGIFSESFFTIPYYEGLGFSRNLVFLIIFLIGIEWIGRRNQFALHKLTLLKTKFSRFAFYTFIVFLIGMFMHTEETDFIYFQF